LWLVEFDTGQTLSETWSQARTCLVVSGSVRVVEFRNDTTRIDQRQSLARPVPNSTTNTRTGPDQTKSADLSETRADRTDFVGDPGRRTGSPTKSGRARLVEFGHYPSFGGPGTPVLCVFLRSKLTNFTVKIMVYRH